MRPLTGRARSALLPVRPAGRALAPDPALRLVTECHRQTGGAVARHLLDAGLPVRALSHDPPGPAAQALARRGAEVVATGDLDALSSPQRALAGFQAVLRDHDSRPGLCPRREGSEAAGRSCPPYAQRVQPPRPTACAPRGARCRNLAETGSTEP
ncbi:NmrA family NAD(P)-binding protein [Streptomyces sp. NPDC001820]|uniref:NmrA family NAD(P)-binding protein n=1 Tax=Streptomyces sp. NPDC001820 TaxID=3364613 RepID=UPI00368D5D56